MNFDELKKTWQTQQAGFKPSIDSNLLLQEIKRNQDYFAAMVFWRDVREAGVAFALVPLFCYFALKFNVWSLYLPALSCIFVGAFIIIDRIIQKRKLPKPSDCLIACIEVSLAQVKHQIGLLKNVFWWYMLPLIIGLTIFWSHVGWLKYSIGGKPWMLLGQCFALLFLVSVGVFWLNRYAIRKELIPRKEELEQLLKGLENDDAPETLSQKSNVQKTNKFLIVLAILVSIAVVSAWFIVNRRSNQPMAVSKESIPAKGLHIVSAKYGAGKKWLDVSGQIRKKIQDNSVSLRASNDIAGDPIWGSRKSLKVEYVFNGEHKTAEVPEGQWLHIPSDVERHPKVQPVKTRDELMTLVKQCPAEVGFFGKNLQTGEVVEYRPDQPACLASIVKIFVLLEVMRQADRGTLELSESITIQREGKKEVCTISQALDKMIGISDNEATGALAARVGFDRVNALPKELGISGLSDKILPEQGVLEKVLDKRVYANTKLCPVDNLLPQHGTARGITQYFELLRQKKLISENISTMVLEVFDRNPKRVAPSATPADFTSVGKGGSLAWYRPGATPYNMLGWGALIRNQDTALAFCVWFEWFPDSTSDELQRKWCVTLSDSIVNILLAE